MAELLDAFLGTLTTILPIKRIFKSTMHRRARKDLKYPGGGVSSTPVLSRGITIYVKICVLGINVQQTTRSFLTHVGLWQGSQPDNLFQPRVCSFLTCSSLGWGLLSIAR